MPIDPALATFGGTVFAALVGYFTAKKTTDRSRETSSETNIYNRVGNLEERVDRLEKENDQLNLIQNTFITHLERIYFWLRNGRIGPEPMIPDRLKTLVDQALWVIHEDDKKD